MVSHHCNIGRRNRLLYTNLIKIGVICKMEQRKEKTSNIICTIFAHIVINLVSLG